LLDKSGNTFVGISTERLYQAIAVDYGAVVATLAENLLIQENENAQNMQ